MSVLTTPRSGVRVAFGPEVNLDGLKDLFAPQTVPPFTPPPTGIDNLGIASTDTFHVVGRGDFTIEFKGFVRVARSVPTSDDWPRSEVYTNLIEMRMVGQAPGVGRIIATLNPEFLSTGQLRTPFADMDCDRPEKACRMAVGALFRLPDAGMVLFNKEPLELTIDNVRAIPPAGSPGVGRIYRMLPLFNRDDPNGTPAAYLTALDFVMGTYISEDELNALRKAGEG
jgi:hypothetical protein